MQMGSLRGLGCLQCLGAPLHPSASWDLLTVKSVAGKAQNCRLIQRASEFMEKLH